MPQSRVAGLLPHGTVLPFAPLLVPPPWKCVDTWKLNAENPWAGHKEGLAVTPPLYPEPSRGREGKAPGDASDRKSPECLPREEPHRV